MGEPAPLGHVEEVVQSVADAARARLIPLSLRRRRFSRATRCISSC